MAERHCIIIHERETRMKRDMDLVREILIAVEEGKFDDLEYDRDQINLHVELMKEHGLVDADITSSSDSIEHRILACSVKCLTWKGHDFLEEARNKSIWEQAKKKCLETTGGLAIELLRGCLVYVAKQKLGIE